MAIYDDTDNTRILHIGVWGFLITAVIVLYAVGLFDWFHGKLVAAGTFEETKSIEILDKQKKDLNNYVPIDPEKGRYGIPIEKAMEETLEELKAGPNPATASL
ncbi:MAG: hypothetical protein KDA65_15425 [Planctomycetaceae bacterium]|nr:hypothetical protein [Planctomycetaceae bacterium]